MENINYNDKNSILNALKKNNSIAAYKIPDEFLKDYAFVKEATKYDTYIYEIADINLKEMHPDLIKSLLENTALKNIKENARYLINDLNGDIEYFTKADIKWALLKDVFENKELKEKENYDMKQMKKELLEESLEKKAESVAKKIQSLYIEKLQINEMNFWEMSEFFDSIKCISITDPEEIECFMKEVNDCDDVIIPDSVVYAIDDELLKNDNVIYDILNCWIVEPRSDFIGDLAELNYETIDYEKKGAKDYIYFVESILKTRTKEDLLSLAGGVIRNKVPYYYVTELANMNLKDAETMKEFKKEFSEMEIIRILHGQKLYNELATYIEEDYEDNFFEAYIDDDFEEYLLENYDSFAKYCIKNNRYTEKLEEYFMYEDPEEYERLKQEAEIEKQKELKEVSQQPEEKITNIMDPKQIQSFIKEVNIADYIIPNNVVQAIDNELLKDDNVINDVLGCYIVDPKSDFVKKLAAEDYETKDYENNGAKDYIAFVEKVLKVKPQEELMSLQGYNIRRKVPYYAMELDKINLKNKESLKLLKDEYFYTDIIRILNEQQMYEELANYAEKELEEQEQQNIFQIPTTENFDEFAKYCIKNNRYEEYIKEYYTYEQYNRLKREVEIEKLTELKEGIKQIETNENDTGEFTSGEKSSGGTHR